MNYYEADILKLEKRIKRLEESDDPTKLKSNKLIYEINLATRKAQLDAFREGRPFGSGDGPTGVLDQAMGFIPVARGRASHDTTESAKYLELGREKGLPVDNSCDMTYLSFGQQESGDMAKEDIFICHSGMCTPSTMSDIAMSYVQNRFTYYLDVGFEENEANLRHVTDQLLEIIDRAEKKFPGVIKYDESRLIELQYYEEAAQAHYHEIYQMLKHKPSPIAGTDAVRQNYGADLLFPDPAKALEFAKMRRDEVAERVANDIGALPEEKLRVIWTVTRPFFMNPFKILEKRGIAMVLYYSGLTITSVPFPKPDYIKNRKLTALEKVAAGAIRALWSGPGSRWVDNMMWVCKDLEIDAIINYCMLGCTATLGLRRLVEETAQKQLGIPTLQLGGKQWDSNYASEATITAQLDEFAQICLERKNRQNKDDTR